MADQTNDGPISLHSTALLTGLPIARTVSSIPSAMGSIFIIQHVLRGPKRRKRTLTRILLGMGVHDLVFSAVSALSSSVVPKEMRPWVPFASGTWATCEATGFLNNGSSVSSAVYNASLTLYYLLTIRYGWKERKVRNIEPWLHFVPMLIGWGTAIPGLPLELYNPTPGGCFIVEYPMGCEGTDCQRGKNVTLSRILLLLVWVWLVFVFLTVAMVLIYRKLVETNRRATVNHRYGSSPSSFFAPEPAADSSNPKTRVWPRWPTRMASSREVRTPRHLNRLKHQFATQALLYCLAFFFTWFFQTVKSVLLQHPEGTSNPTYVPVAILMAILFPLQGFWNFFIYIRPRYLRYRRKQRKEEEEDNNNQQANDMDKKCFPCTAATPRGAALYKAISVDSPEDDDDDGGDYDDEANLDVEKTSECDDKVGGELVEETGSFGSESTGNENVRVSA